jgi:hypothetical protein
MTEQKKKYWREKVTAEITLSHVQAFAQEMGTDFTEEQLASFLNENGLAQGLWMHMMRAGEQYIKSSLKPEAIVVTQDLGSVAQTVTIQ